MNSRVLLILIIPIFVLAGLYLSYLFYPVEFESHHWVRSCGRGFPPIEGCSSYCNGIPVLKCKTNNMCVERCSGVCYGFTGYYPCESSPSKPSFLDYLKDLGQKVTGGFSLSLE